MEEALPHALAETVRTMAERGGLNAAQIAAMLSLDVTAVEATLAPPTAGGSAPLPPGLADAACTMAARGISPSQIATMLKVEEAAVKATLEQAAIAAGAPPAGQAGESLVYGKRINDPMQMRLDALLEEDTDLCCPVTLVLFVDPVKASDGFVYERSAAEALCENGRFLSPMTREQLPSNVTSDANVKERAYTFRRERISAMLAFAEEAAAAQPDMAMGVIDRVSEYLSALPPEAVAMLVTAGVRACDALLKVARTVDEPNRPWQAQPQQLRRVNALRLQLSAGSGTDLRQLTCLVCFDEYPALKGVECGAAAAEAGGKVRPASKQGRHFVCDECLCGHVESAVSAESMELFAQRGGVRCVHPECACEPFSDGVLARALPEATFQMYTAAKERVAEQRINKELEEGFERRIAIERERAGGDARRQAVREHICQRILTLSCPRCGQAFVDFNGCMALSCARAGCGCGFCALCQEDCGNDAHAHVGRGCPLADRIGVKKGEFYLEGGEQEYMAAMSRAKEIRLKAYLEGLSPEQRAHALEDCARELADLKIDVNRPAQPEGRRTRNGGGGRQGGGGGGWWGGW